MSFASSSSSNMYDHQAHMVEVSKLNVSLENTNRMFEEQRSREEEQDRKIADHARQMKEMKKMIEEMSEHRDGRDHLGYVPLNI